ncbi:MAG: hydantoinase/oxoprolinase family protein, partial [Pseudomonadota bacterium]
GGPPAMLGLFDPPRPHPAPNYERPRAERFIKGSGMPVRIPVIDMIEIGAGGGSLAGIDRLGRLRVGPESAGADPGPVAFGKGGTVPTVTDADLALGLLPSEGFAEGRMTLNAQAATASLGTHIGQPLELDADAAAFGVSEIVDESMASAGRMHAVESGKDLSQRLMIAFGGNGPLHATRVASRARVRRILIPKAPGVGSALGFLYAPVSFEIVRSHYALLADLELGAVNGLFAEMRAEGLAVVQAGARRGAELAERRIAFMRYRGQGHEIEVVLPARDLQTGDLPGLIAAFEAEYSRQFSRPVPQMQIEILNWALMLSTQVNPGQQPPIAKATQTAAPQETRRIFCDVAGVWREAALYSRDRLSPGDTIAGPALIAEPQTTTLVSADFSARIDGVGNIWLTREDRP